jgi:hypothetical protein
MIAAENASEGVLASDLDRVNVTVGGETLARQWIKPLGQSIHLGRLAEQCLDLWIGR